MVFEQKEKLEAGTCYHSAKKVVKLSMPGVKGPYTFNFEEYLKDKKHRSNTVFFVDPNPANFIHNHGLARTPSEIF